jgi:nucleotide-binding universal stress UspA family protein
MIKDVAVFFEAGQGEPKHVAAAIAVAKAHGAGLAGVCAVDLPTLPVYAEAPIGADLMEQELERRRKEAARLEAAFRDAARQAKVAATWTTVEGDPVSVAREYGRAADLVVLAQASPDAGAEAGDAEEIVLSLGRPALLVPYVGANEPIGERVLAAWNGSREATRALHDALPFLTRAKSVTLVAIDPADGFQVGAERMLSHLARHGVKAELRKLVSGGLDVGDVLLNAVSDQGADLVVMGAYGHSRIRELVLGGATRTIFRQMTAPVLLSH